MDTKTLHASAVLVGSRGVLIRGASGSGKSSLALALIFGGDDAVLIADDCVGVLASEGRLIATAPPAIAGRLEVRGVGIIGRPHVSPAAIDLVVDLLPLAECPRIPDEKEGRVTVAGVMLRRIYIAASSPDGALRVRAALADIAS
jgi:serine kinase of HPr protein (carbohydrate metabolism regulator)